MSRILVIEDEKDMALGLKDNLEYEGHQVEIAYDGRTGLHMAQTESPHLILLDVMLPKMSGFDVCKEIRLKGMNVPIIMLTAKGEETDKVLGLEFGADDYITKPFSVRELMARVKAVLRRTTGEHFDQEGVQIGRLNVDFHHLTAGNDGGEVEMTHKEYELLKYFYMHEGEVIHRDDLMDKVWGYENYPTSRTVDNYIVKLRRKVEDDPNHPKHIMTVYGVGYKYIE